MVLRVCAECDDITSCRRMLASGKLLPRCERLIEREIVEQPLPMNKRRLNRWVWR